MQGCNLVAVLSAASHKCFLAARSPKLAYKSVSASAGAEPTKDPEALKTPCILHLDSMAGVQGGFPLAWQLR